MPVETDFVAYHKSIVSELRATQNRVRDLIGSGHWPSDGEHKETILRKTLRSHLPEALHIGRGFICYRRESSTQLDVLITNNNKPTLFKEGDLVIVTPDCVEAIIEVKTKQNSQELVATLTKLADQIQKVRQNDPNRQCWAGLFVFDGPSRRARDITVTNKSRDLLNALQQAARHERSRIVNCVSLGSRVFARYWDNSADQVAGPIDAPAWHSYIFDSQPHNDLAPAYFVSNLVWEISPNTSREMQFAWFPIRERGGKEQYRRHFAALQGGVVERF